MTLKAGHWRLFGFMCAAAILFGCRKAETTQQPGSPADAKSQIYRYLAKKSGQKEFAPGIDLDLPKHAATLRSNANLMEQRTIALRASLRAADEAQTPVQMEIEEVRAELAKAKRQAGDG